MRAACCGFLSLLVISGCASRDAELEPEPLCVIDLAAMPANWRPAGMVQSASSSMPWTADESMDAALAVRSGLDELTDFFSQRPEAVAAIADNAVGSFIDASYAAANMPSLRTAAREQARAVLIPLMQPYLGRPLSSTTCNDYSPLLTYAIYAHSLLQPTDPRIAAMVERANVALRDCGSIERAMGADYRRTLADDHASTDALFALVIWSITFTDAQTIPELELPAEARDLPPTLWRYFSHYSFPRARAYREGASNTSFYDAAYLATHLAYIPTGYGRHPIYIEDAPNLYRFLRENFYAVLEMGELDLTAEFVDLFRQYGCTEENDLQLRDGTRYLLKLFHAAGNRWMAHREPGDTGEASDYDAVHKAWTGMAGVRVRVPEPAAPRTYGGVVRQWLGYPR